ncbi:MAG: hypothetical protein ACYC5G_04410 [Candidatus Doudnabacteria bacterium]
MIIETKFNIGECVVTIDNNSIVTLPIQEIDYSSKFNSIKYTLLKYKATSFGDKDGIAVKTENECFESIVKLAEYYGSKQNR